MHAGRCGCLVFNTATLMKHVFTKLRDVCQRWLANGAAGAVAALKPTSYVPHAHRVSLCAIKNTRRKMEDRHLVIHDLNALYGLKVPPTFLFFSFLSNLLCFF